MIESDREEQLAAARKLPRNVVVTVPQVEPPPFSPVAQSKEVVAKQTETRAPAGEAKTVAQKDNPPPTVAQPATTQIAEVKTPEELPAFVPAPKSLVSDRSAEQLALVNTGVGGTQNAMLSSLPKPIETAITRAGAGTAQLSLSNADQPMKIGEKRVLAIELKSDSPLGLSVLTLSFDPKVVKITSVKPGTLLPAGNSAGISQSIDPKGFYKISISSFNGAAPLQGAGSLMLIEVEAIADGDAGVGFDQQSLRLLSPDAREVRFEVLPVRISVKQ